MQRKIILMGGKTHVVSLPAYWVRKLNLRKGEAVNIEEYDNHLKISADSNPIYKSITIDYNLNKLLRVYQAGYDEIKIQSPKLKPLQDFINNFFIGFEIIQIQPSFCRIKSISEINQNELDNFVKRALLILSSNENFLNKNSGLKLVYASKRIISRYGQKFFNKSLILYNILSKMENITKKENLYPLYEAYQKYEANKISIKDNIGGNLGNNLQEEIMSLVLAKSS